MNYTEVFTFRKQGPSSQKANSSTLVHRQLDNQAGEAGPDIDSSVLASAWDQDPDSGPDPEVYDYRDFVNNEKASEELETLENGLVFTEPGGKVVTKVSYNEGWNENKKPFKAISDIKGAWKKNKSPQVSGGQGLLPNRRVFQNGGGFGKVPSVNLNGINFGGRGKGGHKLANPNPRRQSFGLNIQLSDGGGQSSYGHSVGDRGGFGGGFGSFGQSGGGLGSFGHSGGGHGNFGHSGGGHGNYEHSGGGQVGFGHSGGGQGSYGQGGGGQVSYGHGGGYGYGPQSYSQASQGFSLNLPGFPELQICPDLILSLIVAAAAVAAGGLYLAITGAGRRRRREAAGPRVAPLERVLTALYIGRATGQAWGGWPAILLTWPGFV